MKRFIVKTLLALMLTLSFGAAAHEVADARQSNDTKVVGVCNCALHRMLRMFASLI